jgi:hypothetical protein
MAALFSKFSQINPVVRLAAAEYAKILAQRQKEAKEAKELKRKRSASLRESKRSI